MQPLLLSIFLTGLRKNSVSRTNYSPCCWLVPQFSVKFMLRRNYQEGSGETLNSMVSIVGLFRLTPDLVYRTLYLVWCTLWSNTVVNARESCSSFGRQVCSGKTHCLDASL